MTPDRLHPGQGLSDPNLVELDLKGFERDDHGKRGFTCFQRLDLYNHHDLDLLLLSISGEWIHRSSGRRGEVAPASRVRVLRHQMITTGISFQASPPSFEINELEWDLRVLGQWIPSGASFEENYKLKKS